MDSQTGGSQLEMIKKRADRHLRRNKVKVSGPSKMMIENYFYPEASPKAEEVTEINPVESIDL